MNPLEINQNGIKTRLSRTLKNQKVPKSKFLKKSEKAFIKSQRLNIIKLIIYKKYIKPKI